MHSKRNFEIVKIEKDIHFIPPLYYIHVFDKVVEISSKSLVDLTKFQRAVMIQADRFPIISPDEWFYYLDHVLLTRLKVVRGKYLTSAT